MKLPRWLVIGMLTSSVLAVLAAAGWWWVTWPERTAEEFLRRLGAGEFERAEGMLGSEVSSIVREGLQSTAATAENRKHVASVWRDARIEHEESRTLRDLALCRQDFRCRLNSSELPFVALYDLTTERGRVASLLITETKTRQTD